MNDTTGPDALARGAHLLANGQQSDAAAVLAVALHQPATRLAAHHLIEQHRLEGCFSAWMGCDCTISPTDDIFRFFANHPASIHPLRDYFADGWRTLSELMLLLEAVDQPLIRTARVLEFASGHGRFTRHLVKTLGAERVVASDVVADAVDFARNTFGVEAHLSTQRPEDLLLPARYPLVFVLSLFSHLPRSSWQRWLDRLWDATAPGGVLVFSTHGVEAARRQDVALDSDGFFFAASSESHAIDANDYGTAFTSDVFVRHAIARLQPPPAKVHAAPVHFWHHQDAWVLCRATD